MGFKWIQYTGVIKHGLQRTKAPFGLFSSQPRLITRGYNMAMIMVMVVVMMMVMMLMMMIDWLVGWLIDWLTDWLTDWLIDWLMMMMIDDDDDDGDDHYHYHYHYCDCDCDYWWLLVIIGDYWWLLVIIGDYWRLLAIIVIMIHPCKLWWWRTMFSAIGLLESHPMKRLAQRTAPSRMQPLHVEGPQIVAVGYLYI